MDTTEHVVSPIGPSLLSILARVYSGMNKRLGMSINLSIKR